MSPSSARDHRIVVRGQRVVTGPGTVTADIVIEGERIAAPEPYGSVGANRIFDAAERLVLPGIVDSHVHTRDPGQTHKEDFHTASMAAARGGVTTIMAMPNTIPIVDSVQAFDAAADAGQKSIVDFAIEALAHASSLDRVPGLAERGVVSFEMFLGGVPDSLATRDRATQKALFAAVQMVDGLMGIYPDNSELSDQLDGGGDVRAIMAAHPAEIEAGGLLFAVALASAERCRVHLRQTSAALTALLVSQLRRRTMAGLLTAEVTPHHLTLTTADFEKFGPEGLIMPPLRSAADVDGLWSALEAGDIATIGTDHSPHHVDEKNVGQQDLRKASPGFPGLETFLSAVLTEWRHRGLSDQLFARVTAEVPAQLFGVAARKGAIRAGLDADIIIVDDHADEVIDTGRFLSKARYSAFHGKHTTARVDLTMVRGCVVYGNGAVDTDAQKGQLLQRVPRGV
jgi:dihydroorotase (multifunctional complex type)